MQLYILPVNEEHLSFAEDIASKLSDNGIRVFVDHNLGSLSKRILFAHRLRPLFKMVLGKNEISSGDVSMQGRDGDRIVNLRHVSDFLLKRIAIPE